MSLICLIAENYAFVDKNRTQIESSQLQDFHPIECKKYTHCHPPAGDNILPRHAMRYHISPYHVLPYFFRTCQSRRTWVTNPSVNPEPRYECSAWGQDHYKTFDGLIYNFDGEGCEYIMMQHDDVVVTVANKRCEHTFDMYMCKEVKISLPKEKVRITLFQKTYKLERYGTSEVIDYDNPCHDIYPGVMMEYKGLFVILKLYYIDFEIKYDKGSRVYITATSSRHMTGNLRGLCGDFDGKNSLDDFVLPDNSIAVEVTEFANKWAAGAGCVDAAVKDSCTENPSLEEWAQKGRLSPFVLFIFDILFKTADLRNRPRTVLIGFSCQPLQHFSIESKLF